MRLLLAALCSLALAAGAASAASLEARLVRAAAEERAADPNLRELVPKLKEVFGYKSYAQSGVEKRALKQGPLQKFDLGQGFTLFTNSHYDGNKLAELEVHLYSGKAAFTKATIKEPSNSPVFVKGPEVGSGLFIVVLTVGE
jgi:hypothetical protein